MSSAPKMIVGIMSCRKFRNKQQAIAETWALNLPEDTPLYFMEGRPGGPETIVGNRIFLDCKDGYEDLAKKTYRFLSYCRKNFEFTHILKTDDDTYVNVPRMLKSGFEKHDYFGNVVPFIANHTHYTQHYAHGSAYFLSRKAVEAITDQKFESGEGEDWWYMDRKARHHNQKGMILKDTSIEDMMVGDMLIRSGIYLNSDVRFLNRRNKLPYQQPLQISASQISPRRMKTAFRYEKSAEQRTAGPITDRIVFAGIFSDSNSKIKEDLLKSYVESGSVTLETTRNLWRKSAFRNAEGSRTSRFIESYIKSVLKKRAVKKQLNPNNFYQQTLSRIMRLVHTHWLSKLRITFGFTDTFHYKSLTTMAQSFDHCCIPYALIVCRDKISEKNFRNTPVGVLYQASVILIENEQTLSGFNGEYPVFAEKSRLLNVNNCREAASSVIRRLNS